MTNNRQALGRWGEQTAAAYLSGKGYEVVARNMRTPYGEIDLVARREDVTLFIEVKTRTSDKLGNPEESVNLRKQAHMLAAAEHYAAEHGIDHWQIDVIAITGRPGWKHSLRHFENALG